METNATPKRPRRCPGFGPPFTPSETALLARIEAGIAAAQPFRTEKACVTPYPERPKLSHEERQLLYECEEKIYASRASAFESGAALLRIRDQNLFRQWYDSFKEYHQREWQYSPSHVHRLIQAARVFELLEHLPEDKRPFCESQVRPLTPLLDSHPDDILKIWEQAWFRLDQVTPTAAHVNRLVRARFPHLYAHSQKPLRPPRVTLDALQSATAKLLEFIPNGANRVAAERLREQILQQFAPPPNDSSEACAPIQSADAHASNTPAQHAAAPAVTPEIPNWGKLWPPKPLPPPDPDTRLLESILSKTRAPDPIPSLSLYPTPPRGKSPHPRVLASAIPAKPLLAPSRTPWVHAFTPPPIPGAKIASPDPRGCLKPVSV